MTRDEIIAAVVGIEAGYVNNPADPGGATNHGVTQRYLDNARKTDATLPASVADLTSSQATALFTADQWAAIHGDALPWQLAFLVFDSAVNQGTPTAANILEECLGMPHDGAIGPHVVAAVARLDVRVICAEFAARRAVHYASLEDTEATFMLGWMRRNINTYTKALS